MSAEENKTIVRDFFKLLKRDQAIPEHLLGRGFIYHVPGSPPKDLKATRQRVSEFRAAFSESKHIEEDMVAEGDKVAFRTRLEMIHTGEFMGVPGRDENISVVEMGIMRMANGKIVEMWGLLDNLGLMQQTGALATSD